MVATNGQNYTTNGLGTAVILLFFYPLCKGTLGTACCVFICLMAHVSVGPRGMPALMTSFPVLLQCMCQPFHIMYVNIAPIWRNPLVCLSNGELAHNNIGLTMISQCMEFRWCLVTQGPGPGDIKPAVLRVNI
jgi:hypothetical protein